MGALIVLASSAAGAQDPKRQPQPYAVVGGTVFQDGGLSQSGAKVVLALKSQPKKKLQEQISSPRGEFAFRVPPDPATYIITATLKGFGPIEVDAEVQGQEQIHKSLILTPASKKR